MSFRREKFVPKGGPDGGNGGRGGDIILKADSNEDNLVRFYYEPILRAGRGGHGQGKGCHGRAAPATIVKVPLGTLVYRLIGTPPAPAEGTTGGMAVFYDLEKELPPEPALPAIGSAAVEKELIADLTEPGQEFVLCRGGAGGWGNIHFKSSRNRAPRQFTRGEPGEEGDFFLELRKIADAGLVGYPNAGKSTLLGRLSSAHPKVAPYPFTTLHPMIGVIEYEDFHRVTLADIPGLIEGAHRNVGLGHDFLRHIVRCKLLVHVLDMAGSEGRSPLDDFVRTREELKLYDPALVRRPWIVVANKMDLPGAAENVRLFKRRHRKARVVPVSAQEGTGLELLRQVLREELARGGVR